MRPRFALFLLIPALLAAQSVADLQKSFEKKVTEFTLANGLHFIVIERHEAPVVSFHTYMNVGSVDDPSAESGLAHMFEHMAFKGTPTIGTKNWPEEKAAMDAVDVIYNLLDAERSYQQALITQIQARASRLSDTAALYTALGGGWRSDEGQAAPASPSSPASN